MLRDSRIGASARFKGWSDISAESLSKMNCQYKEPKCSRKKYTVFLGSAAKKPEAEERPYCWVLTLDATEEGWSVDISDAVEIESVKY
jgi:hypothetical protein